MAELLKAAHPITTLRLQLEPKGDATFVLVAVDQNQTSTDLIHASTETFGIPDDLDGTDSFDFRLPDQLMESVGNVASDRPDPSSPLWIQFAGAVGALTAIPWEELFAPVGVPVLRLPYSAVPPLVGDPSRRVAVIASMPRAKTAFPIEAQISRAIELAQTTRPGTVVDVFTDHGTFEDLTHGREWPEPDLVTIHDPKRHQFVEPSASWSISTTSALTNPWLQWAAQALGAVPVDLVHFISPGYHCFAQGSLAFAPTPMKNNDEQLARFIGATELQTFLRGTGTWYVHLTDATSDVWGVGVRLLADELAQTRTGIVAIDDPSKVTPEEAAGVRRFALGEGPPPPTATALYCHPGMVEGASEDGIDIAAALRLLTLVGSDAETVVGQHEAVAGWITSTQRYLEDQVGQLLATARPTSSGDDPGYQSSATGDETLQDYPDLPFSSLATSPGDDAANRGVADALQFIADIVGHSSSGDAS